MESRLKEIVTITDVQSATENNDPNQDLNKQGSYTAAVYFADNEVTNPVAGADLVANILRLVVKKSPTGESTHYFFFMLK